MNQVSSFLQSPSCSPHHWDQLLTASNRGVHGPDATCSATWARALSETLLKNLRINMVALGDTATPQAILPYYAPSSTKQFGVRTINALSESYMGRYSVLAADASSTACSSLLDELSRHRDWDKFQLTFVENSITHETIYRRIREGKMHASCIQIQQSPYILLSGNWEDTFNSLPKKLRWTIRKGEKDLAALGQLTHEQYTRPDQLGRLFEAIYAIEQQSWKEKSGTSITTQAQQKEFYEALAKYAAQQGMLSAHVLRLDGNPLAYIFGLSAGDGVFLDLKESFAESHAQYSSAHVLKRFVFPTLIEQGVRVYDFMGACETYKMRWTDKIYRRYTVVLFNNTIRGRLLRLKSMLSKHRNEIPPAVTPAVTESAPIDNR